MKRTEQKQPDEIARPHKRRHIIIAPTGDTFGEALRAACVPQKEGDPFSNQPLIVNGLNSDCWLSDQVAYWPANEEIGRRVYIALAAEDGQHDQALGDTSIHLIMAFMKFDTYKKYLCKLLGVSSLKELGVLRHVGPATSKKKKCVAAGLLDCREFRLDLQY